MPWHIRGPADTWSAVSPGQQQWGQIHPFTRGHNTMETINGNGSHPLGSSRFWSLTGSNAQTSIPTSVDNSHWSAVPRDHETSLKCWSSSHWGQSKLPHMVAYGPIAYQGLNLPNLYVEELITHISTLLKYGPQWDDPTGVLTQASGELLCLEASVHTLDPAWWRHGWAYAGSSASNVI